MQFPPSSFPDWYYHIDLYGPRGSPFYPGLKKDKFSQLHWSEVSREYGVIKLMDYEVRLKEFKSQLSLL